MLREGVVEYNALSLMVDNNMSHGGKCVCARRRFGQKNKELYHILSVMIMRYSGRYCVMESEV